MASANSPSSADFVIVGGGTAGLVVASRLSEDANVSVLVLEAGQSRIDDPRVQIPALWTSMLGTEVDWQLNTVPQPGLNGRTIKEPQGKMLGGSSALNGQAFIAPSQAGIDAWAKLGNPGWTWDSLLPYYKKFYTLHLPDQATRDHLGLDWIDESVRGTNGPIQASFPGVIQNPIAKAWVDAFKNLHYNTTGDPFSGKSVGGYSNAAAIDPKTQTRSYSATQYGLPASKRPNFSIVTDATVQRVLFDDRSSVVTASGVEVMIDGKLHTIQANKEVILCAGVFHTPKLLELSGIGNESLLNKFGIPVVVSNPGVGENMQDHLMTGVSFEVVDGVPTGDPLMRQEPEAIQAAMQMYTEHKAGPMCVGGVASSAFMPLMEFAGPDGQPLQKKLLDQYPPSAKDAEYYNLVRSIIESPDEASSSVFMFLAQANLHEHGKSFVGQELQPGNFASLGCMQSHPFSRGSTHISSAKPEDQPTIDPRYFSHPLDLEIMARHLQSIETIRDTEPLARFFKPDGRRNHPEAYVRGLGAAKKYLRDTALTSYHTCGTAAMLPREMGGVVSERLVVHGTKNLRVVDASIFPLIPRANPMSTVYAVAEKAADIIRGI